MKLKTKQNLLKLAVAITVSELAGVIGAFFTRPAINSWYGALAKPDFTPPSWVFGPVWTILFALMGVSLFLIWKSDPSVAPKERRRGMALFFIQLVLNTLWSIIFFGMRNPGAAFVEIIFLWLAILATIIVFAKISKPAAILLLPYILWVSFAAFLNYSIWKISTSAPEPVYCAQDVMVCSDGSYVGRVAPDCEFAPCPASESLAGQLKDCLPKSDMASRDKCEQLLKAITDFDECVAAGFLASGSPSQCGLPDGRVFTR
jgi:tryptophan-rich sensory protein